MPRTTGGAESMGEASECGNEYKWQKVGPENKEKLFRRLQMLILGAHRPPGEFDGLA